MGSVNASDLAALKHMKSPPNLIKRVLDAVLILLFKKLDPVWGVCIYIVYYCA